MEKKEVLVFKRRVNVLPSSPRDIKAQGNTEGIIFSNKHRDCCNSARYDLFVQWSSAAANSAWINQSGGYDKTSETFLFLDRDKLEQVFQAEAITARPRDTPTIIFIPLVLFFLSLFLLPYPTFSLFSVDLINHTPRHQLQHTANTKTLCSFVFDFVSSTVCHPKQATERETFLRPFFSSYSVKMKQWRWRRHVGALHNVCVYRFIFFVSRSKYSLPVFPFPSSELSRQVPSWLPSSVSRVVSFSPKWRASRLTEGASTRPNA